MGSIQRRQPDLPGRRQNNKNNLGLDVLTLRLASFSASRTGTVIGFLQLTMWLGHGSYLVVKIRDIEGKLKSLRQILVQNLFSIAI